MEDGKFSWVKKENGIDVVFDERGNTILALREIGWGGREPKLEMRKWFVGVEDETPNKGFSFLTEEGPHNLAEALVSNGYGDTKTVLQGLEDRPDFGIAVSAVLGENPLAEQPKAYNELDPNQETYYDPREIL